MVDVKNGIRILIADDHNMMRQGLARILADQDDIHVIAEAKDGRDAVAIVQREKPDVVIMDIGMPELNGIDATARITQEFDDVNVIAISTHTNVEMVTEMLRAGAKGFLLKECAVKELTAAIRKVANSEVYLCGAILGSVVDTMVQDGPVPKKASVQLSLREREVLQLIAEGHSTRAIAGQLTVSAKTIESHRRQLMSKLGIDNIAGLTKYAIRHGITSLDY